MQELFVSTDLDASLRFIRPAEEALRFCAGLGWLHWDGTRWVTNSDDRAVELAKFTARKWSKSFLKVGKDGKLPDGYAQALGQENGSSIRAAVKLAESADALLIKIESLDTDPWVINVKNGTLDLRTGKLLPHQKENYITKLAPVEYIPRATHPALDRYLKFINSKDVEMGPFLARCFGAALTGDASAESLFLLQGDGASGKTTLVEAIASMMGDYAAKLRFESFCLSKHGRSPGGASPDLITLRGARLAYASEGDQSAKLDAGLIKELTGKENLTARALYRAPITFPQTWKLWLVTNYDPKVDSDDTGIWRRVLKLHFEVVPVAERDPSLKEVLSNDPGARSALLAWCLAGCLDWQARGGGREGLAAPKSVEEATRAYHSAQDLLGQWWSELLATNGVLDAEAETSTGTIRAHYEKWCQHEGTLPVQAKRFRAFLEGKGLLAHRSATMRGWKGIYLDSSGDSTTCVSFRPARTMPQQAVSRFQKPAHAAQTG